MSGSLLNRKAVRACILAECKRTRPWLAIERVSAATYDVLEAEVHEIIRNKIRTHPSRGVTFYP